MKLWKIAFGFVLIEIALLVGFFRLFMQLDQRFVLLSVAGSGLLQASLIVAAWLMMEREYRRGKSKYWLHKQRLRSERRDMRIGFVLAGLFCIGRVAAGFYRASQAGWTKATVVNACLWTSFAICSLCFSVFLNKRIAGLMTGTSETQVPFGNDRQKSNSKGRSRN